MRKINILYVITKLELGGAQKQLLSLIRELDKKRFKPFLFTAEEGLLIPEALSINGLTLIKSIYLERAINPFKDFFASLEIYRFIKNNEIDIVHTHSSKAGILGRWVARLAKVGAILHTVHGWSFHDYQSRPKRRFFVWLEKLSAKFTDRIIVVSHHDRGKGLKNRIGKESNYCLIRYGIDYREFSNKNKQDLRKELGISASDLVVGMIACLKPQKSPQDFIKLADLVRQTVPEVKFLLIGDGILRSKVERLITKLNLQNTVILTGWRRDIPQILSALDVFVLNSLWEGLPITVLEAMVASRPVIVTHTGGVQEVIVEGETGFLAFPQDLKKMAERLIVLLKDARLREAIGQKAKNYLGMNFCLENMVSNTQRCYENLVFEKGLTYAN